MSQTHPLHPYSHAQLIANSEQILSGKYSRRLITMEKARPYDAEAAAAHHEAVGTPRWADSMFYLCEIYSHSHREEGAAVRRGSGRSAPRGGGHTQMGRFAINGGG